MFTFKKIFCFEVKPDPSFSKYGTPGSTITTGPVTLDQDELSLDVSIGSCWLVEVGSVTGDIFTGVTGGFSPS